MNSNTDEQMKMNKKIEETLEECFPKGDKARGRALLLHAIAQIECNKLESKRAYWEKRCKEEIEDKNKLQEAYDIAMQEINRLRKKNDN